MFYYEARILPTPPHTHVKVNHTSQLLAKSQQKSHWISHAPREAPLRTA